MGPKLEDFEVVSLVGSGTSGTVRKVRRRSDGRILVWKELHYANMSESEKQGLVQEVNLLRELRNPHIVRFLQHIVDKRSATLYIIMEHCPGGDLRRLIARCRTTAVYLEEAFVWRMLKQLCEALRVCHTGSKRLVLHRDIKPANVFLDEEANVKLGDFGLARTLSSNASFATSFVGTPYYMSPEVVEGRDYNEKSDMWSLGCLVYELCALHPPFQAASHNQLAIKIRAAKYDRIPAQYSDDLWEVVQLLLTHEDFLRPTVLMILYHNALRRYTTPQPSPACRLSPPTVSPTLRRYTTPQPSPSCTLSPPTISPTIEASSSTGGSGAPGDPSDDGIEDTPTGRYAANACRVKSRLDSDGGQSSHDFYDKKDGLKSKDVFDNEEHFLNRRTDRRDRAARPLSRISEAEGESSSTNDSVFLPPDAVPGSNNVPVPGPGSNNIHVPGSNNVILNDDPLANSLCPKVLLAAREKAQAAAIAKENEGTRTMSRDEIDNTFGPAADSKMDTLLDTIVKMKVCRKNSDIKRSDVTDRIIIKETQPQSPIGEAGDCREVSHEEETSSDSNDSVVSVRSAGFHRHDNSCGSTSPDDGNFNKRSDIITVTTVPVIRPDEASRGNFLFNNKRTVLNPRELVSCVSSTETKITETVMCRMPSTDQASRTYTKDTVKQMPKKSEEPRLLLETSLNGLSEVQSKVTATETHLGSDCACGGMPKSEWKTKLSSLRENESSVRERERNVEDREREVSKREKRANAMEQDARQHLIRAQIYRRQSRGGHKNQGNVDVSPPFISPGCVNTYRYRTWSDTVSAEPADTSVILTAAIPDLNRNPFVQMRTLNQFSSDPCMAKSCRDADDTTVMERVPSVPADARKAANKLTKTNTLSNLRSRSSKRKTTPSLPVDSVAQCDPDTKDNLPRTDSIVLKSTSGQLKVRSNNIFSSFRSGNKTTRDEPKDKTTKSSTFRLPLLPSRKTLKKSKPGKNPAFDKENLMPVVGGGVQTNVGPKIINKSARLSYNQNKLHVYAI